MRSRLRQLLLACPRGAFFALVALVEAAGSAACNCERTVSGNLTQLESPGASVETTSAPRFPDAELELPNGAGGARGVGTSVGALVSATKRRAELDRNRFLMGTEQRARLLEQLHSSKDALRGAKPAGTSSP